MPGTRNNSITFNFCREPNERFSLWFLRSDFAAFSRGAQRRPPHGRGSAAPQRPQGAPRERPRTERSGTRRPAPHCPPPPGPQHRSSPRTDSGDEGGVEGILGEAEERARLPHARVADEQQLEQIVVRLRHVPGRRPCGTARPLRRLTGRTRCPSPPAAR